MLITISSYSSNTMVTFLRIDSHYSPRPRGHLCSDKVHWLTFINQCAHNTYWNRFIYCY